jgi:peptide-methionine (S)-S-oxide reductase
MLERIVHCEQISYQAYPCPIMARLVLGGGCFWCIEASFKGLRGVQSLTSGYAGGHVENPTYEQICGKKTGHAEIVDVDYDENIIDYATLLRVFFTAHDPTQLNRQGNDIGPQYRSIVFVEGENELNSLNEVLSEVGDWFNDSIVTEIAQLSHHVVYPAEGYHQDYFANNPQNPYCSFVVAPKVVKVRKKFAELYHS